MGKGPDGDGIDVWEINNGYGYVTDIDMDMGEEEMDHLRKKERYCGKLLH